MQIDYDRLLRIEQDAAYLLPEALAADKNPSTVAQALQERWRADPRRWKAARRQGCGGDAREVSRATITGRACGPLTTPEFFKTLNPVTASIRDLTADFKTAF